MDVVYGCSGINCKYFFVKPTCDKQDKTFTVALRCMCVSEVRQDVCLSVRIFQDHYFYIYGWILK